MMFARSGTARPGLLYMGLSLPFSRVGTARPNVLYTLGFAALPHISSCDQVGTIG